MKVPVLVLKEVAHRKLSFFLAAVAVTVAVALFIAFFTAAKAADRETARVMLTMGFNVHIIPNDTDVGQFLLTGLTNKTMPQEYLDKLGSQEGFSYNHLLGTLQQKISWRGSQVILTGLAPEICPPGQQRPPVADPIETGTAYVGYVLANMFGLKAGDTIEIRPGAPPLRIARCLFEQGNADDIRIQCHLKDAQQILGLAGQISEIRAVDCLCFAPTDDPVAILRQQIISVLPEARVFHAKPMATARAKQRQMVRGIFAIIMPLVIIVCGTWIGVLAILNVRDRQVEIGIMRALGYGSGKITSLFLGRAVLIGLSGAIVGFAVGTVLALHFGPGIFKITAERMVRPQWGRLIWLLLLAPAFAAVSSFIPAMIAVSYDPAVTLREE